MDNIANLVRSVMEKHEQRADYAAMQKAAIEILQAQTMRVVKASAIFAFEAAHSGMTREDVISEVERMYNESCTVNVAEFVKS